MFTVMSKSKSGIEVRRYPPFSASAVKVNNLTSPI